MLPRRSSSPVLMNGTPLGVEVATIGRFGEVVVKVSRKSIDQGAEFDTRAPVHERELYDARRAHWKSKLETPEFKRDGTVLRPVAVRRHGSQGLHLTMEPTKYSRYTSAVDVWQGEGRTDQQRHAEMLDAPEGNAARFVNNLGVSVGLITADDKWIAAVRSTTSSAFDGGRLAPAAETVMAADTTATHAVDLRRVAAKGLLKEFGIATDALTRDGKLQIEFTSYFGQLPTGGMALLGTARTSLTAAEVIAGHPKATDQREVENLQAFEWSPDGAVEALTSNRELACWLPSTVIGGLRIDPAFGPGVANDVALAVGYEGAPLFDRGVTL